MSQQKPRKAPNSEDVVANLTRTLTAAREGDPLIPLLEARAAEGEKAYGTRLQTHNGRDALQDAHEELLDALAYLWQAHMETASDLDKTCYLLAVWRDLAAIERQVRCLRAAGKDGLR